MIESLQIVKTKLLESIEERVKHLGFRKNVGRQSLHAKTAFGKYVFHIAFINHEVDVDVVADVAIRHDSLEDLLDENNMRPYLDKKQKQNTTTFGIELGILTSGNQKRWTIKTMTDIEKVVDLMVEEFFSKGLPYLHKYSDLKTAFKVILNGGKEAELLNSFPDRLAMNGIGLAFLLGEKEAFYYLAETKEKYLTPINNSGVETFLEFKEKLQKKL